MAQQTDAFKRYLDAGLAFTQLTRDRAESVVRDLVKAGAVQREKTEKAVEDLMDRSRKNSDQIVSLIRKEVRSQLSSLGFATKDDVARLERRLDTVAAKVTGQPATKRAATKKVAVKRVASGETAKPAKKAGKTTGGTAAGGAAGS